MKETSQSPLPASTPPSSELFLLFPCSFKCPFGCDVHRSVLGLPGDWCTSLTTTGPPLGASRAAGQGKALQAGAPFLRAPEMLPTWSPSAVDRVVYLWLRCSELMRRARVRVGQPPPPPLTRPQSEEQEAPAGQGSFPSAPRRLAGPPGSLTSLPRGVAFTSSFYRRTNGM